MNVSKAKPRGVIRDKVSIESVIHSDDWQGYGGLVEISCSKHYRVRPDDNEFMQANSHTNCFESWGSFAKSDC